MHHQITCYLNTGVMGIEDQTTITRVLSKPVIKKSLVFPLFILYYKQHCIEVTLYLIIFKLTSSITGQDNKMVSICDA